MNRPWRSLVLTLTWLVLGCVVNPAERRDDPAAPPLPSRIADRYASHAAHGFEWVCSAGPTDRWSVLDVSFRLDEPVLEDAPVGSFEWYVPVPSRGRAPVVLVAPILKGDYSLERNLARTLAAVGISAAVLHQPKNVLDPDRGPRDLDLVLRHYVIEARAVVDWLSGRPEIDPERMGVLGVSLGSLRSAVLLAVEPRVKAGVLVIGGGDVAGIFRDSVEDLVRRYVEKRSRREGITESKLLDEVREALPDDPLALASFIDRKDVLVVLGRFDRTVPYRHGRRLLERLPHARGIVYPTGHYSLVLFLGFVKTEFVRFFLDEL